MTKKDARNLIQEYGQNTAWYGNPENRNFIDGTPVATCDNLYNMFRGRFGMGKAESICLIAALKLSGAEIVGELTEDY